MSHFPEKLSFLWGCLCLQLGDRLAYGAQNTQFTGALKQKEFRNIHTLHTHATMQYLEQFLGILQKVEAVFDPASGNFCSLLSDLFPSLTFCLTWVREKDKKMLSTGKERECIYHSQGRSDRGI